MSAARSRTRDAQTVRAWWVAVAGTVSAGSFVVALGLVAFATRDAAGPVPVAVEEVAIAADVVVHVDAGLALLEADAGNPPDASVVDVPLASAPEEDGGSRPGLAPAVEVNDAAPSIPSADDVRALLAPVGESLLACWKAAAERDPACGSVLTTTVTLSRRADAPTLAGVKIVRSPSPFFDGCGEAVLSALGIPDEEGRAQAVDLRVQHRFSRAGVVVEVFTD